MKWSQIQVFFSVCPPAELQSQLTEAQSQYQTERQTRELLETDIDSLRLQLSELREQATQV